MTRAPIRARLLHSAFLVGVALKGIDGVVEILAGCMLLVTSKHVLVALVSRLTKVELAEDPKDLVANYFIRHALGLSESTMIFMAIYLLVHGLIKGVLVGSLLLRRLWAYPTMLVVLSGFIIYQLYRLSHAFSIELAVFTVLDAAIALLVLLEYQRLRKVPNIDAQPSA